MRHLYLVCYDISDPRRLRRIGRFLKGYKSDGQKSVCECHLSGAEKTHLVATLHRLMVAGEDRIQLYRLDPRQQVQCFGATRRSPEHGSFIL